MRLSDFQFDLPEGLIAQQPLAARSASRLLCLDGPSGERVDRQFTDLPTLLRKGDLLVFNDTRVIPARLFGRKESGGKVEVLIERILDSHRALAHVRASKSPKPGSRLILEGAVEAEVQGRQDNLFELTFAGEQSLWELLEAHGHMPLPPYIQRADEQADRERYQTIYADKPGAVAAPTAGLHFDQALLDQIKARGVQTAHVTLHVGAGTFQPVRCDDITQHQMHAEPVTVTTEVVEQVRRTKAAGGRVVAVGTTSLRSLETASIAGDIAPFDGLSRLFCYPGFRFNCVDALVTNFHLSESTLLMLVAAFAGHDQIMAAYRHAVAQHYRFFSYGDAMFLVRKDGA